MSRELHYRFEELPLVIENGFSAGLVNGSALVSYWLDGQWGVSQIYLDGHKRKPAADLLKQIPGAKLWDERDVQLDRGDRIHAIIWDRLEHDWRASVQEAVNEAIDAERVSRREGAR